MDKESYVYDVFQEIADDYDGANNRISLGNHLRWKSAATTAVLKSVPHGGRVLDLGCGTGDMIELMLRLRADIRVTGLDFSPKMLDNAQNRFSGDKRVTLVTGNAMELAFSDGELDAAVIAFALRNMADYSRVLAEMTRVVKTAGAVCCIDSFTPEAQLIKPFYKLYFTKMMPLLGGGRQHRTQYRWLNRSTSDFLRADELSSLMRSKGLERLDKQSFMFGSCVCICGLKAKEAV